MRLYHATTINTLNKIIKSGKIKGMWTSKRTRGSGSALYWAKVRRSETGITTVIIRADIPLTIVGRDSYGYYRPTHSNSVSARYITGVWVWSTADLRWMFYQTIRAAKSGRGGRRTSL